RLYLDGRLPRRGGEADQSVVAERVHLGQPRPDLDTGVGQKRVGPAGIHDEKLEMRVYAVEPLDQRIDGHEDPGEGLVGFEIAVARDEVVLSINLDAVPRIVHDRGVRIVRQRDKLADAGLEIVDAGVQQLKRTEAEPA